MGNLYANDFTDNVKIYYKELKRCKPINYDRERELLIKSKEGDVKARNELITANLRFVFDTAKKYTGRGVSIAELISEGNMGLMKAIDKFDPANEVKFITYAVWWVRHYMMSTITKHNEMKTCELCPAHNDRKTDSIMYDEYDDECQPDKEELAYKDSSIEQSRAIDNMLELLDSRERDVIEQFFGLKGELKTLNDIGKDMGLTSERVRQIKNVALRKMKCDVLEMDEFHEIKVF